MADIHDTIEQLYPDNEQALITPEALRTGLHQLARLGPNQRNDLWKSVRFMTRAEANADGNGGEVFEELDFSKLCFYSTVLIEFYRETPASSLEYLVRLVAVYDGGPNPNYHLQRTASFAEAGLTVPAKFVRADSLEAQLANIPFYKAGTTYKVDDAVQYQNGPTLVYVAKQAGKLPAPSSVNGDAYWRPTIPPVAEIDFAQVLLVPQARELARTGKFKVGRLYIITLRADDSNSPLEDVRIRALTENELEPTGLVMQEPPVEMKYDLATDMTSATDALATVGAPAATIYQVDGTSSSVAYSSDTLNADISAALSNVANRNASVVLRSTPVIDLSYSPFTPHVLYANGALFREYGGPYQLDLYDRHYIFDSQWKLAGDGLYFTDNYAVNGGRVSITLHNAHISAINAADYATINSIGTTDIYLVDCTLENALFVNTDSGRIFLRGSTTLIPDYVIPPGGAVIDERSKVMAPTATKVGPGLSLAADGTINLKLDSATLGVNASGNVYVAAVAGNISASATPTNVTAVRDQPRTKTTIRWDAKAGATLYQVYRASDGGPWTFIAGVPYPYFVDTSSSGGSNGYVVYRVTSANSIGESAPSAYVAAA